MCADLQPGSPVAREGYIQAGKARLYYREIGRGQPLVVLHGGPDFDHNYFLPDLDRLSDSFRLIYYDQRGRGKSGTNVESQEISMQSEIEDLESVRRYFQLESVAVLGHSWGGVLAMEYAIRHPDRVSHLVLMNTAPASREDYLKFRQARRETTPEDIQKLMALSTTPRYQEGDLEADAEYYGVHFKATVRKPEHLQRVVNSLRGNVTKEGIVKAREIEDRLVDETWLLDGYSLFPGLERVGIPTLVIHGDYDLVPAECAAHVAQAIPGARFALLKECGHFSFIERPEEVYREIVDFFGST